MTIPKLASQPSVWLGRGPEGRRGFHILVSRLLFGSFRDGPNIIPTLGNHETEQERIPWYGDEGLG